MKCTKCDRSGFKRLGRHLHYCKAKALPSGPPKGRAGAPKRNGTHRRSVPLVVRQLTEKADSLESKAADIRKAARFIVKLLS